MVVIAQLVRASDCGSEGRGFEPHFPPLREANFYLEICLSSFYQFNVCHPHTFRLDP